MNGQMMNYKKYYESLKNTPEPGDAVNLMAIDYKGLVAYAKSVSKSPVGCLTIDVKSRPGRKFSSEALFKYSSLPYSI